MHPNARLTYRARLTLGICSGRPPAHVASEMGVSRRPPTNGSPAGADEDGLEPPQTPFPQPRAQLERAVERSAAARSSVQFVRPVSPSPPRPTVCSAALINRIDCSTVPAGSRRTSEATCSISLGRMPEGGGCVPRAWQGEAAALATPSSIRRRPLPSIRSALQRTRRNRHRFPAPGVRLVRQPRCSDTHCLHRQRRRLPQQAIPSDLSLRRHPLQADSTLSSTDQREGRALSPMNEFVRHLKPTHSCSRTLCIV